MKLPGGIAWQTNPSIQDVAHVASKVSTVLLVLSALVMAIRAYQTDLFGLMPTS